MVQKIQNENLTLSNRTSTYLILQKSTKYTYIDLKKSKWSKNLKDSKWTKRDQKKPKSAMKQLK